MTDNTANGKSERARRGAKPERRVLVTGATGYIASQLLPAFRERYDLTLLAGNRTNSDGRRVRDVVVADLIDPNRDNYRTHFRGVQTVVHCAWVKPKAEPRLAYPEERQNVDMAYNVYQTSLEEGVERVVVASSNHAADWYEHLIWSNRLDMVYPDAPRPLSDNYYGWAKEAYEHLGFVFASGSLGRKLGIVQVRIGAPREIDVQRFIGHPTAYKRDLGAYISERDMRQLFVKSIEAPSIEDEHGVPFQVFYGISANARAFWSIANARQVIGYEPRDDSEVHFARDIAKYLTGEGHRSAL